MKKSVEKILCPVRNATDGAGGRVKNGVDEGTRTPDLLGHNQAL
jgi:hypothetical protein